MLINIRITLNPNSLGHCCRVLFHLGCFFAFFQPFEKNQIILMSYIWSKMLTSSLNAVVCYQRRHIRKNCPNLINKALYLESLLFILPKL